MKKIIFQGVILLLIVFSAFMCMRQLNWVKLFHVQQITVKSEQKLGDLLLDVILSADKENKSIQVYNSIDSIVNHICLKNNINREQIKIHVVEKDEINAFAMPNGHLIVYSGLIQNSDNQEELTGVLCHEIAHIQLNHVMKKMISEMGLSMIISISSGNGSPVLIKKALQKLSSLSYERTLEKEADLKGVDYMINAEVDPSGLAEFLFKQSNENATSNYLQWASSHPDSRDRAVYINDYIKNKNIAKRSILCKSTWNNLKDNFN